MKMLIVVGVAAATVWVTAATRAPAGQKTPLLLPGSTDLIGGHFVARCTNVQRFGRAPGETTERPLGTQRVTEQLTEYHGKPAVLLVTSAQTKDPFVDSALMYRDGLAPIIESYRTGKLVMRWDFDGPRVRMTTTNGDSTPVVKDHRYAVPVFNFQQLDIVIRSLPLRAGSVTALPLYSEGDDSLEVDTVRVQRRTADGVWQIKFVDPAVIATMGVDEKSRAQVAYSHTFRQNHPPLKAGTVWRQEYHACKSRT